MLQTLNAVEQFGQLTDPRKLLLGVRERPGGSSPKNRARWDVFTHSTLGTDLRTLADFDMSDCANLSPKHDIIPQAHAPSDPGPRAYDAMLPNLHVVSDLHQIIDLGPLPDPSAAKSGSINGTVRADFHIVIHLHDPCLRNLDVATTLKLEAEAVAAQDNPGMENCPVADDAASPNGHAIRDATILTDHGVMTDVAAGSDNGTCADPGAGFNDYVRLDTDAFTQLHARRDHRCRMYPWGENDGLRREAREYLGECQCRILAADEQWRYRLGKVHRHERNRCLGRLEGSDVFGVAEEGHVALTRFIDARSATDPQISAAFRSKLAAYEGGQLLNR